MVVTTLALALLMANPVEGTQRPNLQRADRGGIQVGQPAKDFELKSLDGKSTFKLSSNYGKKPTVLIFGSYT